MSIDTLSYAKKLEAAGVPRAQAEAQAEALRDEIAPQIATTVDLGAAVDRLDNKIETVTSKLDHKIDTVAARLEHKVETAVAKLEAKITIMHWMLGVNLALTLGVLWRLLR